MQINEKDCKNAEDYMKNMKNMKSAAINKSNVSKKHYSIVSIYLRSYTNIAEAKKCRFIF